MSIKLRDLIRAVRACKTAAEERAVISKECALIRTAIKEEDEQFRHRNIAKLMYIHMLGYPTHFGQMECLKLISATTFPEKRVGYLGLTLLLTESTEVLTLVTNSLKVDLTNTNQYIQALALVAIGNLATQDMARDLAPDIEKILKSSNSYLRKKAALATIRLFKKETDLIEHMSERVVSLLKDRAHGVLLTGLQLIIDTLDLAPEYKTEYAKLVPTLVRLLRNFISMGFSPEHDVAGITDPFMQVKILNLLRRLGNGDDEASEHMNDVLAQVATNTETTKNAGNAILYECVQTIMGVQSDSSLRVLAINILGRFLLNRDNNIRYVALNSLSKVVAEDMAAVQRQRNTIVDCLKDPDVSIRQRALELIYQLVNEQNVVTLTTELLNYLVIAQSEHKVNLISKIVGIVEKYSPNQKWRIDTLITVLTIAGNFCDESVTRTAIILIAQSQSLQSYAAHKLYSNLTEDTSQTGLVNIAVWCIGEYGESMIRPCPAVDSETPGFEAVSDAEIIDVLDRCLRLHNADVTTKSLILNALIKLSVRLPVANRARIVEIVSPFQNSMSLELQQRSSEFTMLLTERWDRIRGDLLAKMPILDEATMRRRKENDGSASSFESGTGGVSLASGAGLAGSSPMVNAPSGMGSVGGRPSAAAEPSLLDLDDIFGGPSVAPSSSSSISGNNLIPGLLSPQQLPQGAGIFGSSSGNPVTSGTPDLLADIFSLKTIISPTPQQQPQQSFGGLNSLLSPMNTLQPTNLSQIPQQTTISSNPVIQVFDKGGLQISMEISKPNPSMPANTRVVCKYSNQTAIPITDFNFQAAVPKYLKLDMLPASSAIIPPNSTNQVTQEIRLINSAQGEKNIMMKLKIVYKLGGNTVEEMTQVSSFPALY